MMDKSLNNKRDNTMRTLLSVLAVCFLTHATCYGQGFGGGGAGAVGANAAHQGWYRFGNPSLHPSQTQRNSPYDNEIMGATGSAVVTVKPESLRLVFAVTADKETSQSCADSIKTAISNIRNSNVARKIAAKDIVEDFINVEPKYTWAPRDVKVKFAEDEGERDEDSNAEETAALFGASKEDHAENDTARFLIEIPDGFRMQTNLHVLCKDEQQALDVMDAAFKAGVNDIISFDYWHSGIDKYKKEVLKLAIEEAKAKADILLTVFDEKPQLLNIHSEEKISYPENLYRTIAPDSTNLLSGVPRSWRDYAKIRSFRPRITFYTGAKGYYDRSPIRPAMHPEIAVSSKVTLTYGTPARDETMELERLKANNAAISKKPAE